MKKRIKGKLVYLVFVVWMIVLASGNSDWFSGGDELFNLDEDINMSYFLNLSSFVNNCITSIYLPISSRGIFTGATLKPGRELPGNKVTCVR